MKNFLLNLDFIYDLQNSAWFKVKYFSEKVFQKITRSLGGGKHYFFSEDYILKTKDFSWNIRAHSDFDEVIKSTYERDMIPYFACSGVFVDVGTHIGKWSLLVSKTASEVYSFEPNPDIYKYLVANIKLNDVKNVKALNIGLSSSSGKLRFFADTPEHSGSSKITEDGDREIEVVPLDRFDLPEVELIKIDVEGHELDVLKGAERTLKNTKRVICEIWEDSPRRQQTLDFMEKLGFQNKQIDPNNFFFVRSDN